MHRWQAAATHASAWSTYMHVSQNRLQRLSSLACCNVALQPTPASTQSPKKDAPLLSTAKRLIEQRSQARAMRQSIGRCNPAGGPKSDRQILRLGNSLSILSDAGRQRRGVSRRSFSIRQLADHQTRDAASAVNRGPLPPAPTPRTPTMVRPTAPLCPGEHRLFAYPGANIRLMVGHSQK